MDGTVLVKDIWFGSNPTSSFDGPRYLTNVDGTLYFSANDGTRGRELWEENGTETGTQLSHEITPWGGQVRP